MAEKTRPGAYRLLRAGSRSRSAAVAKERGLQLRPHANCGWDDVALTVMATVVSRTGNRVIVDAGSKVLGADRPAWATGFGRLPEHPDARVVALSEHHATVEFADEPPALGDVLRVAPNHVCATVNLAGELVVVRAGAEVDRWRVAARGANT